MFAHEGDGAPRQRGGTRIKCYQKLPLISDAYVETIWLNRFLPAARSGGRSRSHFVSESVSQSAIDTKMNHLEGLYAKRVQRKDV